MRPPIQVWFEEHHAGDLCERRLVFDGAAGVSGGRVVFWWRLSDAAMFPAPPVLDSLLVGPALWAARRGQDLVVQGPMSPGGWYNLAEYLAIRFVLSPERYPRQIDVRPAALLTPQRPPDQPTRAVAALSGGLDSMFTVVRHARRLVGDASYPIRRLVMVQGFDAPLDRPDRFDAMRRRAEPLAEWLGLPLHVVATNTLLDGSSWPQSAIPLAAGALAQFSSDCGVGLLAAGAPYGTPRFGVTHPNIVDALCSNDYFRVVSDGSGFGRSEKAEALLPFAPAVRAVKVCWQGDDPGRNCGVCHKCVMTRLNFLAAGMRDPACFDTPLGLEHIRGLRLATLEDSRDLFRMCWNELAARDNQTPERWLLERRLSRVPPGVVTTATAAARRTLGPVIRPARRLVRRLLGR